MHMAQEDNTQQFSYTIASITVTSDRSIAPYIDSFAITPQNIIEREHGSLIGFFRIYDESEDSAYIANFLTSVLKKEFYASTRRDTEASLEAALAKVNIALGELARHDSTQWVGKVDGAVCVFTQNSVCFSSCGRGAIQLFRDNRLMHISVSSEDATDILSTFSDIACGPLHNKDSFIIASREFETVLPHDECERACIRYTHTEREQLFRTALVNQTDGSCVHIVDITPARVAISRRAAAFDFDGEEVDIPENVFSADTFSAHDTKLSTSTMSEDSPSNTDSPEHSAHHIYLQGEEADTHTTPFGDILRENTTALRSALRRYKYTFSRSLQSALTKTSSLSRRSAQAISLIVHNSARISLQKGRSFSKTIAQKTHNAIDRHRTTKQQESLAKNLSHTALSDDMPTQSIVTQQKEADHGTHDSASPESNEPETSDVPRVKKSFYAHKNSTYSDSAPRESLENTNPSDVIPAVSPEELLEKIDDTTQLSHGTSPSTAHESTLERFLSSSSDNVSHTTRRTSLNPLSLLSSTTEIIGSSIISFLSHSYSRLRKLPSFTRKLPLMFRVFFSRVLPRPRHMIATVSRLTLRQRLISAGIIGAIILVPLIVIKSTPATQDQEILYENPPTEEVSPQTSHRDASSKVIERSFTLHSDADLFTIVTLRGETYGITPRKIIKITNSSTKETFDFPQIYGSIIDAVAMQDLNMIILRTTKNDIISFVPLNATKFSYNNITFPSGLSIDYMATYLTYLYFFDSNGDDIYRYPRATGGFGAAVDWLTDGSTFSAPRSVDIDGSIYLVDADGNIQTFFNHKKTSPLSAPNLSPELVADALFTQSEEAPLFILDRSSERIIALSKKTSDVIVNVTNEDFSRLKTFTVNERLSTITGILDDGTVTSYRY